jgi:hypothetical protein
MTIIDFESGKPIRPGYLEWRAANPAPTSDIALAAPDTAVAVSGPDAPPASAQAQPPHADPLQSPSSPAWGLATAVTRGEGRCVRAPGAPRPHASVG